jgi:UDP-4-amino-4,6-dideoxy-N-acetyl-beta-L-altrosamine N-acetyltransferase
MRFVRFGITLERLQPAHLELVRHWRNSDWVRPYMRYRTMIQPAAQKAWFENLDPERDWYFCTEVAGRPLALFHVKSIDWQRASGEAGGFVADPGFIGRPEPALATLALMDFAFLVLRLDSLEAQYSAALRRVVRFNQQLGYRVFRREPEGFVRAQVGAERYFKCAEAFRKAAALHGGGAELSAVDPWLARRLEQQAGSRQEDFALTLVSR